MTWLPAPWLAQGRVARELPLTCFATGLPWPAKWWTVHLGLPRWRAWQLRLLADGPWEICGLDGEISNGRTSWWNRQRVDCMTLTPWKWPAEDVAADLQRVVRRLGGGGPVLIRGAYCGYHQAGEDSSACREQGQCFARSRGSNVGCCWVDVGRLPWTTVDARRR